MATTKAISSRRTFRIVEPVAEDGTLTVVETATDTTFHVVDYADDRLREKVAGCDAGSTVRLDLAPADPEGIDWLITRVMPGAPVTAETPFY